MATDVASLAFVAGGVASKDPSVLLFGALGYVVAAPITHLAAGRPRRALGSFGLRVLAAGVATGAVLGDALAHPCDGEPSCRHSLTGSLALGTVVMLTAALVDDAGLSRERAAAPAPSAPARATLAPALVVGPSFAFLSAGGVF